MKVPVKQRPADALKVFAYFVEVLANQSLGDCYKTPKLSTVSLLNGEVTADYEDKKTLAEAVTQAGEAIYHWLTGISTFNELSFYVDGYPGLDHYLSEQLESMISQGECPKMSKLIDSVAKEWNKLEPPLGATSPEAEPRETGVLRQAQHDKNGRSDAGGGILLPDGRKPDELLTYWEEFWKQFDIRLDPSPRKLKIPSVAADHFVPHAPLLLIMPQGLTLNLLQDIMLKMFSSCWFFEDDFDKQVTANDRTSKDRSYSLWVADSVEAPELLKNKSAKVLKESGIITQVLAERLVQGIERFKRTGQHLDILGRTLCGGSRWFNGDVPCVDYVPNKKNNRVGWSTPNHSEDRIRGRAVVLCQ